MKKLILTSIVGLILVGCAASNPHYSPINPRVDAVTGETNDPAPYVADPRVQKIVDAAKAANTAIAPANPYAPITGTAVDIIGAAALAVSGWIATYKSRKLVATQTDLENQKAVTHIMAQGVVKANAVQAVSEVASSTPHFAAVVNHINEATP